MKKIKLKDLAIKSFVTSVEKKQKQTIGGGETGLGFCLETPTQECNTETNDFACVTDHCHTVPVNYPFCVVEVNTNDPVQGCETVAVSIILC